MAKPSYLDLIASGEMENRICSLYALMEDCRLCPRNCKAKRLKGETGECGASDEIEISSAFPHIGEEPPITGTSGSGTVFFTNCSLRCVFCQNYDISHLGQGQKISVEHLAGTFLHLQRQGVHNINLVTPTHYAPQIIDAVSIAADEGLDLPLVWNCGGYESIEVIRLLNGIVDIYMPDVKFMDMESSKEFLNAPDYPANIKEVLHEMHNQVGVLRTNAFGIAERGLLIRHLVMPGLLDDTDRILEFIASELSPESYVNVMDQYRPLCKASEHPSINHYLTEAEFERATNKAKELGLTRGLL